MTASRNHRLPEDSVPRSLTVGQLIRQLQTLDPTLPVRLAVNPDWPFSHYIGRVTDAEGTAFIAEDGQEGYLPHAASTALDWTTDAETANAEAGPERPDDAPWYLDGQDAAYVVTELLDRPDWTVDDTSTPVTYTAPGSHLQVRLDEGGWLYEARETSDTDPVWHAYFAPAVPTQAIRAFTTALLTSP